MVATVLPIVRERFRSRHPNTFGIFLLDLLDSLVIGPGCTFRDPVPNIPLFLFGQGIGSLGRHLVIFLGPRRREIEIALGSFSRNEHLVRKIFAPPEYRLPGPHIEVALELVGFIAMTCIALFCEERLHMQGKELLTFGDFFSDKNHWKEESQIKRR